MRKRITMVFLVLFAGLYLYDAYVWQSVMRTQAVKDSTMVRPEEMEDYDPEVGIKALDEGTLQGGIDYEMSFLQRDNQHGTTEPIEGLVHEVTNDDYESYEVVVCVKNNTDEALSGMKLYLRLPDSIGERSVVGNAMTLTAQLEYDGMVARKALNLVGSSSPIEVTFPGGSAGFIKRGDSEMVKLPAYEESVPLFDYWQNEGFELDVPAGEKWVLSIGVNAHAVADFEVQSSITSMDGRYVGERLYTSTAFWSRKQLHVVTEITNLTDMNQPAKLWLEFDSGIDLIPGSVKLNGQQINDFVLQDELEEYKFFETAELGVNAPHETMTLEYDIEARATDGALFIDSLVTVGTTSAWAYVGFGMLDATIASIEMLILSMVAIFIVVYYVTKRRIWKGAE